MAQAQALAPEVFAGDETRLVALVVGASAQGVPKLLAAWKLAADLQAAEVEAERLHAQRALHLSADWSGMLRVNGLLDPRRRPGSTRRDPEPVRGGQPGLC